MRLNPAQERLALARRYLLIFSSLVGYLAPPPAGAQTVDPGTPTVLPPVSVEGVRAPEFYRLNADSPEVRVTREEFERQPNDRISDVLGRMPGVVLGGPPGEKKAINFRGVASDFTRLQLDGLQLPTTSQSRSFEAMNIPSFLIDEVRIIRNPTAQYEADGLAGRIALTTRAVPEKPTFEGRAAFGSTDTLNPENRQLNLAYGEKTSSDFGYAVAANYDRRTITKRKPSSERTYSGGPGGAGFLRDEVEPKDYENFDGFVSLTRFLPSGEITFRPVLLYEHVDVRRSRDQWRRLTGVFQDRTATDSFEESVTGGFTVSHKQQLGGGVEWDGKAGFIRSFFDSTANEKTYNSSFAFDSGSSEDSKIDDNTFLGAGNFTVPLAWGLPQELKFGLDSRYATRTSNRDVYTLNAGGARSQTAANITASQESDYDINETYLAGFLQNKISLTNRLSTTPGLRTEYVLDELSSGTGTSRDVAFLDFLPSLPVTWNVTDVFSLHSAVSRQVNRPKFEEIAPGITRRGPRTFRGNADLKPARSWGYDVGANFVTEPLFLGINYFHREVKDFIESFETSTNNFAFRNTGDGHMRGVELEQRIQPSRLGFPLPAPFSIITNQTFIDTRVNDPNTGPRRLTEQPSFVANGTLEWNDEDNGLLATLTTNFVTERITVSNEGSGSIRRKVRAGEVFIDAYAEKRLVQNVSVFASAENLFNEERDEVEFLNSSLDRDASIRTGRVFFIGAKVKF